jgi:putative transposase
VKGRKRHLAVDSMGLPMAVVVTGAQVQDCQAEAVAHLFVRLRHMLVRAGERLGGRWSRLHEVFGDNNYRGTAGLWARLNGFELHQVKRQGKGFEKLPKRWVIERTLAWLFNFRRLLFDLEYKPINSEGMIWLAAVNIMLQRLWPKPGS